MFRKSAYRSHRYWQNRVTGEVFDSENQPYPGLGKRRLPEGTNTSYVFIPISEEAYQRDKELLSIHRDFFSDRAQRYKVSENDLVMIWSLQYGECALCGNELKCDGSTHTDHIIPKKKGGKDVIENLQFLCADCNYAKRDLSTKDFIILCFRVARKNEFKIPKVETMKLFNEIWRTENREERIAYHQEYSEVKKSGGELSPKLEVSGGEE